MSNLEPDWQELKDLVADALDLEYAEREAYLEQRCGGSPTLLSQARQLLSAYESAGDFMETAAHLPCLGPSNAVDPSGQSDVEDDEANPWAARVGRRVGSYEITRFIAAGGMGVVHEAVQLKTGRHVALKIMRQTLAAEACSRFQREVEILGRLQHHAIAPVIDAGICSDLTELELPYFVLELVDGVPLGHASDGRSDRERLELLIQVCDGVQHAHERGVVHRDLKPDNILVTPDGRVKILDFGIARVVGADDEAPTTAYTRTGQFLGTLAYMSPEQLGGRPSEIDARCDVFALGVILYELLARRLPFDPRDRSLVEAAAYIRDVDPASLSSIDRAYRGDLDTITAKALAKDKRRRYTTVAELADDLRRYLRDDPIAARPPTTWYQLRKFARRHRWLCGSVTGAILLLTLGVIGTSWGYLEAERQRVNAEADRDRALAAEGEAEAVNQFLSTLLSSADPHQSGREVKVREILDLSRRDIDRRFVDQPAVAARLHAVLGWTYHTLGEDAIADEHLNRAIELQASLYGASARATLESENRRAQILLRLDRNADADAHTADVLSRARAALGDRDPLVSAARANRALWLHAMGRHKEASRELKAAIESRRHEVGPEDEVLQAALNNQAIVVSEAGEYALAVEILRDLVQVREGQLGAENPATLVSRLNLAYSLGEVGENDEALSLFEAWYPVLERVLGADHPDSLSHLQNFGSVRLSVGDYEQAAELFRRAYEGRVALLGPAHTDGLTTLNNLCVALLYLKRFAEAEPLAREMVRGLEKSLGTDHPRYGQAAMTMGNVLSELDRQEEAHPWLAKSLASLQRHLGDEHPQAIIAQNNYAQLLREVGRRDEAVVELAQVVERYARAIPTDLRSLSVLQFNYGRVLSEVDQPDDAIRELRQALERSRGSWGPDHAQTAKISELLEKLVADSGGGARVGETRP